MPGRPRSEPGFLRKGPRDFRDLRSRMLVQVMPASKTPQIPSDSDPKVLNVELHGGVLAG